MIFIAAPLKEVRPVEKASAHLLRVLGPATVSDNWEEADLPEFVFRVMSEEHFRFRFKKVFTSPMNEQTTLDKRRLIQNSGKKRNPKLKELLPVVMLISDI